MQINKEPESEIVKKPMKKTQKEWIKHFKGKNPKMISAPDIYGVENKEVIKSLIKDFKDDIEFTNSTIIYDKNSLYADIIHDKDSIVKEKNYRVKVPVLNGNFEENKETEKYLQALFDTKDSIDTILKVLKKFGKDKKIRLWTPDQSGRKSRPIRSVELCFIDFDGFYVIGYDWFGNNEGYSRGVIIDSAKQTKKIRGKTK